MYGMVNSAIMDLIVATHGEETWQRVKFKAGVEEEIFISNDAYPDELTYKLVGAASEVLEQPANVILIQFGRWWVLDCKLRKLRAWRLPPTKPAKRPVRAWLPCSTPCCWSVR